MNILGFNDWPLWAISSLFVLAVLVIGLAGIRLTRTADRLADISGLGEALFGAVLLGGMTSLPGIVTSVWTAYEGYPQLSVSNAIGGIAAQTMFLAIADMAYPKANLEHAAASVENLVQAALLMTLLAIPLLAMAGPEFDWFGIHPASLILFCAYLFGLRLIAKARAAPLWKPHQTYETQLDQPEKENADNKKALRLWLDFLGLGILVGGAGFAVAQTSIVLVERTFFSETVVGMLFTAVATSLPELVTAIAAVRRGALTLAVGGIIGGNSFDILFIACADIVYRKGSIYHAIATQQIFIIALTQVLTGILLLGLLRREKSGIGNIGFESFLVLLIYFGAVLLLLRMG